MFFCWHSTLFSFFTSAGSVETIVCQEQSTMKCTPTSRWKTARRTKPNENNKGCYGRHGRNSAIKYMRVTMTVFADLFGDGNSIDKDAQINLRKKLESVCRPAQKPIPSESEEEKKKKRSTSLKDQVKSSKTKDDEKNTKNNKNKRNATEVDTMPDWLRQKACLERRQQKRHRSAAVANWTFGDQNSRSGKPSGPNSGKLNAKSGSNGGSVLTSLGASHAIRKNRSTAGNPVPSRPRNTAIPPRQRNVGIGAGRFRQNGKSKSPASFKGLLSLLGQQAEKDNS